MVLSARALLPALLVLAVSASFAADLQPPAFGNNAWFFSVSMLATPLPPDSLVLLNYTTIGGQNFATYLVAKGNGSLAFYTPFEIESISFAYDDPATPAQDGAWIEPVREKWGRVQNTSQAAQIPIVLEPVGDIAGTISDSSGAPIGGVAVEIGCSGGYSASTLTSHTGAFAFPNARAGTCLLAANASGLSARQEFSLSHGEFKIIELELKEPQFPWLLLLGAALLLAVVSFGIYRHSTGKKKNALKASKPDEGHEASKPESMPTKRQSDLLTTLDTKEKRIVEFVIHYHPGSVRVSKLRRELLIPKTSLTRTLQSLERKRFLKVEKAGSRMFARLNDFFIDAKE